MAVAPAVGVKACPTCGREVAESVSVCDSCEAWATALVEARPEDDTARISTAPTAEATALVAAAKPAPASHRQLTLIAAGGVAVVALTGFAISTRGGSASDASGAVAAPATDGQTGTPNSAGASRGARRGQAGRRGARKSR